MPGKLRITSAGPDSNSARLLLDGEDITEKLRPVAVLLQGGELNTVFIEAHPESIDLAGLDLGEVQIFQSAAIHPSVTQLKRQIEELQGAVAELLSLAHGSMTPGRMRIKP